MEDISRGNLRNILKKMIIENEPALLNYLTQEKVNRVHDFHRGCKTIFVEVATMPYNDKELEQFSHKLLFDFYREIVT